MSEFQCSRGHLMSSGDVTCRICGGRVHTMDGFTSRQLAMMEADYERDRDNEREEEELEEDDE